MKLRAFASLCVVGLLASAVPSFAGEADKYLPENTQAVIVLNVKQWLESPLVKKDLPKLQDHIKANAEAQKTLEDLAFDPLKDLDSITIGAAGAVDQDQVVIVARGKFNVAKFKDTIAKHAEQNKEHVKIHQVNGQTIYEVSMEQTPKPLFVAMVDGNTIVASVKQSNVSNAFAIQAGKQKGAMNKEIQGLISKTDPKHSLSVAIIGGAFGGVPLGDKVENIQGGITLSDEIKTNFVITTKDAESATALSEQLLQGLEFGKQMVGAYAQSMKELAPAADLIDVLKVVAKDNTVTIKGDVTKEAIKKLEDAQKK